MSEPVTKRLAVDRIEGDIAVLLDDRRQVEIPAAWLPPGATDGSWITLALELDPDAEASSRSRIEALQSHLKRRR